MLNRTSLLLDLRGPCTALGHRTHRFRGLLHLVSGVLTLGLLSSQAEGATPLQQSVHNLPDLNPAAGVFETNLVAEELEVFLGSAPGDAAVKALSYQDPNAPAGTYDNLEALPLQQIVVHEGDEVIIHFRNKMGEADLVTSLHFHGIELDNDSDGTAVTQNEVPPEKPGSNPDYVYRFKAPRPGVYWFHPHMKPGPQVFAGLYGAMIVRNHEEDAVIAEGRIPSLENTHTLVLSDTEFDVDGDIGYRNTQGNTDGQAEAWGSLLMRCKAGEKEACKSMVVGDFVLANGHNTAKQIPTISAKSGAGIRLRTINAATYRYFRLAAANGDTALPLYRIGGEGGLLQHARLEGTVPGGYDFGYDYGEILVAPSGRSDIVVVPEGDHGDVIEITGKPFDRGSHSTNNPAGVLFRIVIDEQLNDSPLQIAAGSPILAGHGHGPEDLRDSSINIAQLLPPPFGLIGMDDPNITLKGVAVGQSGINGVTGHFESPPSGGWADVPTQGATRYSKVGDVLELTVSNLSQGSQNVPQAQHHPFHQHGFSFQPLRIVEAEDHSSVLHVFDHVEYRDVVNVPGKHAVVFRMRIEDRPRITDDRPDTPSSTWNQAFPTGGAKGRWVFHCHLFMHAAAGMISELFVLGSEPKADAGPDQVVECEGPHGALVQFDGSGSTDPDGDDLSFVWSPFSAFQDPFSATPVGSFALGVHDVGVSVSDDFFGDEDSLVLEVVDTRGPELASQNPAGASACGAQQVEVEIPRPDISDLCDLNPTMYGEVIAIDGVVLQNPRLVPANGLMMLGVGEYSVRWTAIDATANVSTLIDTIVVAEANDTVECCTNQAATTIVGSSSADHISEIFSSEDLNISGLDMGDAITSGAGHDCLVGGPGADHLSSSAGDDLIFGGDGADSIHACIYNLGGQLTAHGGRGDDQITGQFCQSTEIYGGPGADAITGSAGPDLLVPGSGQDTVSAGGGDDTIEIYHVCEISSGEQINGGSGYDTLLSPLSRSALLALGVNLTSIEEVTVRTDQAELADCQ